jgi:hypothetical protein
MTWNASTDRLAYSNATANVLTNVVANAISIPTTINYSNTLTRLSINVATLPAQASYNIESYTINVVSNVIIGNSILQSKPWSNVTVSESSSAPTQVWIG